MSKQTSLWLTVIVYTVTIVIGYITYLGLRPALSVLMASLVADVVMTLIIFIGSNKLNNSSLYDPYWSVIPMFIVLVWILELHIFDFYTSALFLGVLVWGLRLTLNWVQNFTGYSHEDFRYVEFRQKFGSLYWLISLLGIHLFPTLIVFLGLYPIYHILTSTVTTYPAILLGTFVMILGAYISFVADNQLRSHKQDSTQESIKHGLWKYSRHPNYFGEVFFWFGILVSSWSTGFSFITPLGFLGMVLLFNFYSVPKMEQKLLRNKADYQEIMDTVPRFFFRKPKAD